MSDSTLLGQRLYARRVQLGLSIDRVASRIGVSVSVYTRWERGSVRPKPASLARVARALDTTVALLAGESDG